MLWPKLLEGQYFAMKQLIRFLIVGTINTLVGYGTIFACMYLAKMSPEVSNIAGYLVGLIVSYSLHKNYTYESKGRCHSEKLRFLAAVAVAYAANFIVLVILIHQIEMHAGMSQILAGIMYVTVSFIMNKYYVFKVANITSL
jgi:putative flippase GtrA